MMKFYPALALLFLSGCKVYQQQAYYVSPFNGNSEEYHSLPMHSDSANTAIYIRGGYSGGTANENNTDRFYSGDLSVYAAHHFGSFQCYYGVDATLGNYKIGTWDSGHVSALTGGLTSPPLHAAQLDSFAGPKTFGSTGFSGGINFVVPTRHGEWRLLGLETSMHYESGDYLAFRRKLPDSLVNFVVRSSYYGTLGLSSEIIGQTANGEFGFRVAWGWVLGSPYQHVNIYDVVDQRNLNYRIYTGLSFHYTYERYTGYMQVQFGEKESSFHVGLAFRLGRPRLPPHRH